MPKSKGPEKTLATWVSPVRPFKRRTREFYITLFATAGIFVVILTLISEFLPILLVVALVFLYYVMSTVEPEKVTYTITNQGISIGSELLDWSIMGRFWFTHRLDNDLLVIEAAVLSGRMEIVIPPQMKDKLNTIMSEYLVYEEIPPSIVDKTASWLSGKVSIK